MTEFLLGGVAVAAILIFYGWFNAKDGQARAMFLVGGGVVLLVLGIFVGMDATGIEVQTYGGCQNFTFEDSYVWDGYCNVTDLFPTIYTSYVQGYLVDDGTHVAGNIASTYYRDSNYLQVEENGANFNITFNFTSPTGSCPTYMRWVGRYQGPANRYFEWYVLNWTSGSYESLGFAQVDSTAGDQTLTYSCPTAASDYINSSTGEIELRMVTANSANNGDIYTDEFILFDNTTTTDYSVQTQVVECERDNYNTTWQWGPCYHHTLGFNWTQAVAIVLMLMGVGLMVGVWQWVRTSNPFQGDGTEPYGEQEV